jgi:flavin-binding protein dodecin
MAVQAAQGRRCRLRELPRARAACGSRLGTSGAGWSLRPGTRVPNVKGKIMTVARITEISSVSGVSFQDAILQGVERAHKTLKNVKGAWVKDQEVSIDDGKVTGYKVILKVTFILTD